jgi:hypothetical protein
MNGERKAWYLYIPCQGLHEMAGPVGEGGIFVMSLIRQSVRLSAWNNSASTRQIFIKFDI